VRTLPKVAVSILIGSILTYLFFLYGSLPRNGPSPLFLVFFIPFQILANLITKDRNAGEFAYFGLQIAFYTGISYFVISLFTRNKFDQTNIAFVALGSNLGDSRRIILDAMMRLQNFSDSPILKSSLWQTSPVDCPPESPKFLNAVVGLIPSQNETPESLLKKLRELEVEFGRAPKTILNEPRALDLDLIAFGNEIRNSPELILPHSRAHLRKFVLQPLSEIASELILPNQTKMVSQLLDELKNREILVKL
jgi:2-amino-4-hydroxy-6-hydroxymethyldihydropteridine diphosphokinase